MSKSEVDDYQFEHFENSYFEILAEIQAKIENLSVRNSNSIASTPTPIIRQQNAQINLPPINVPKFNGSYEQWLTFRDTYKSMIHEKQDLSNIQKFHR